MHDVADGEGIDMIFFSAIVWVELGSKYDNVKSFFDNIIFQVTHDIKSKQYNKIDIIQYN